MSTHAACRLVRTARRELAPRRSIRTWPRDARDARGAGGQDERIYVKGRSIFRCLGAFGPRPERHEHRAVSSEGTPARLPAGGIAGSPTARDRTNVNTETAEREHREVQTGWKRQSPFASENRHSSIVRKLARARSQASSSMLLAWQSGLPYSRMASSASMTFDFFATRRSFATRGQ